MFNLLDLPVPVLVNDDGVLGLLHLAALPDAPGVGGSRIVKLKIFFKKRKCVEYFLQSSKGTNLKKYLSRLQFGSCAATGYKFPLQKSFIA